MKKFTFKPTLAFLSCCVLFAIGVKGQTTTIVANSTNTAAVESSTTNNAWVDVGSVDLTLTAGDNVLVLGTIEADVTLGNSDLTCKYRLSDGSTYSPIINRYVTAKLYNDYGIAAIGYIFSYSGGASGVKSFKLQHTKDEPGNNKKFTSRAVLVAMVIDDENVSLPNSIKTTGDVTTTSTSFVQVTDTKTDAITLTKPGGIYLTTSFSTFGSEALTAGYVLRYSTDGTNFTEIPNASISRTNSTDPGAATISVLLEKQNAGTYYFDVAHKTSTGTLTTSNLSLCAVGLVDATGEVFPTFKTTGQSASTSSTSFVDAASEVTTSVNGTNEIFVHSTFNMSSASIVNPAAFQLAITGTGASFTPQILQRYIPADGTGSGGIVGLASGLNAYTDYTIKLQHQSSTGSTLNTSNANLVGFQLTSSPTLTWDGSESADWNDPLNWTTDVTGGVVPISNVHVQILDVTTPPIIATNVAADCYDLTINEVASLTIQSNSSGTGSLIVNGAASGNVTVERYISKGKWHYISAPVNDLRNFNAFLNLTAGTGDDIDQFYWWDEDGTDNGFTGIWFDILNGSTGVTYAGGSFMPAQGYAINYKSTGNDKTISFLGEPYTSNQSIDITKTVVSTKVGSNLVGNPFTSTIAANSNASTTSFLSTNTDLLDGTNNGIYLWNEQASYTGNRDDYVTISNLSNAAYIALGQAFMLVKKDIGTSSLQFNTNMQEHGAATFYKNTTQDDVARLYVSIENNEGLYNEILIGFLDGMTDGLDISYDVGKLKGNPDIALYTKLIEDNGADFAHQALPPLDNNVVAVKTCLDVSAAGNYTFKIKELQNFDETVSIKLEDKLTGSLIDFRQAEEYSFYISEPGEIRDRFVLHFNGVTGIEDEDNLDNSKTSIQSYASNKTIYISNPEMEQGHVNIYSLTGQLITSFELTGVTKQQYKNNTNISIAVIQIQTDQRVVSQKLILN